MRSLSSSGRGVGTVAAVMLAAVAVAHPPGDPRPLPAGAVALGATVTREAGIEFVTIPASAGVAPGQTANRPWQGRVGVPSDGTVNNRGSVGYDYRIGRYEVTTAQWVEFLNAALDRAAGDRLTNVTTPAVWGASSVSPVNPGGRRFSVAPGNAMAGVGGITWRQAAMYCNWLHNDKRMDRSAFLSGAYDTSLFAVEGVDLPISRQAGAKFFIPTVDEWIKAAYFDPNRTPDSTGQSPQWWAYPISSDTPMTYGPPGVGMANALFNSPNPFAIPLGAYTNVYSPWGLFDVAGGTSEWTETIHRNSEVDRVLRGSFWTTGSGGGIPTVNDVVSFSSFGAVTTSINTGWGFRIAAAVPAPSSGMALAGVAVILLRRRRTC